MAETTGRWDQFKNLFRPGGSGEGKQQALAAVDDDAMEALVKDLQDDGTSLAGSPGSERD